MASISDYMASITDYMVSISDYKFLISIKSTINNLENPSVHVSFHYSVFYLYLFSAFNFSDFVPWDDVSFLYYVSILDGTCSNPIGVQFHYRRLILLESHMGSFFFLHQMESS